MSITAVSANPQDSFPDKPQNSQKFQVISAEEYERFRANMIKQHQPNFEYGIGLAASDAQCKSIEVLCAGIGVALLEIFAGRRPIQHVAKWLSKECQDKVALRAQVTSRMLKQKYARTPLNHSPFAKNIALPKPRRVRAQRITPTVFEVCLIMQDRSHVRAMAMRVEKVYSTWKITALEIA